MKRRQFLYGVGAAGAAGALGAAPAHARRPATHPAPRPLGSAPTVTPADIRFPSVSRPLRYGTPRQVGLLPDHVARITTEAESFLTPGPGRPTPSFPGCTLIAVRDGVIVAHEARGHALRYAGWDDRRGEPVELPPDRWVPMAKDTLFDMASVTKLFTSTVAAQLAEQGVIDLDAPVARYLPPFAASDPAKAAVTVRQLLVHRSGLVPWLNLYALPDDPDGDNATRMAAIYTSALQRPPGTGYAYSDLNMITLAVLMEEVTGSPLDALVADRITGPLGLRDTLFNPPPALHDRVAATEDQPWTGRGMIRGSVHDENAWALGGVAGHAGLFSTARDMAVFAQTLADGGRYGRTRLMSEDTVRAVLTDHNADIGASPRGLGWQVDQRFYMDALTTPVTAGHTGYTGTSVTVDPLQRMVFVLLTNRVHPTRERGTDSVYRRRPTRAFARAVPVRPTSGRTAWRAHPAGGDAAHLTAPLRPHPGRASATFDLWYDTEPRYDVGTFAASTDDGASFSPVPLTLRTRAADAHRWSTDGTFHGYSGRRWLTASAELPPGTTHVRWSYAVDGGYEGRGVHVDRLRVTSGGRPVFDDTRPADAARLHADGWSPTRT
ncbi:serine hydrolase domain-containing protein [Streptomyces chumphonensis]|uniref:Serine hydrolase n=1 Tax=Streptomyces chumphonensis TaxID=1214925 RepID=A0A927IC09_9ACTN|nr:serine hydrolase domain-containing protein [Streptomyces chumphonensis]MBD3930781.1 serine hydrolase [Streptomyces chumphonensis]